jgi:transcriptional regulator
MPALRRPDEIPPGTLSMLILKMLDRHGELHGFEIASHIEQVSEEVLRVEEGSLYPALQRLLREGLVTATWGVTKGNRRARYYHLTNDGRQRLAAEADQYERVAGAIFKILDLPEGSQA